MSPRGAQRGGDIRHRETSDSHPSGVPEHLLPGKSVAPDAFTFLRKLGQSSDGTDAVTLIQVDDSLLRSGVPVQEHLGHGVNLIIVGAVRGT